MHVTIHSDPAHAARFFDILNRMIDTASSLSQASQEYQEKNRKCFRFLPTGKPSTDRISDYYRYIQALRIADDRFTACVAELSVAMTEADQEVLPQFVAFGDKILQEYLQFCRGMNDFLKNSEKAIRSDSPSSLSKSWEAIANEYWIAENRFRLFLIETATEYGVTPKIT